MGEPTKHELLIAIHARLERAEHELAHAAIEWLEIAGSKEASKDTVESFRVRALGEYWRRSKLRELYHEVRADAFESLLDRTVYLMALDSCDPPMIPSFRDWLAERSPPATMIGVSSPHDQAWG